METARSVQYYGEQMRPLDKQHFHRCEIRAPWMAQVTKFLGLSRDRLSAIASQLRIPTGHSHQTAWFEARQ